MLEYFRVLNFVRSTNYYELRHSPELRIDIGLAYILLRLARALEIIQSISIGIINKNQYVCFY